LRRLWLRSRERAQALKDAGYRCKECNRKQSKAKGKEVKIEVHHAKKGVDIAWDNVIDIIYSEILIDPNGLVVLCKECHKKAHEDKGKNTN
jgi:predicted HNH restriction endonuclease